MNTCPAMLNLPSFGATTRRGRWCVLGRHAPSDQAQERCRVVDQACSIRPLVDTGRFLRLVALLTFTRDRTGGRAHDTPTRAGNDG